MIDLTIPIAAQPMKANPRAGRNAKRHPAGSSMQHVYVTASGMKTAHRLVDEIEQLLGHRPSVAVIMRAGIEALSLQLHGVQQEKAKVTLGDLPGRRELALKLAIAEASFDSRRTR